MASMATVTGRRISWLVAGLLVCLLIVGGLVVQSQSDVELPFPPANTDCRGEDREVVHEVTLDALLHGPAKITCSGRWVRVKGFLVLEFEDHSFYQSREAAERERWTAGPSGPAGLWVSVDRSKTARRFNQRNVILTGKFRPDQRGHLGGWPGEITDVASIDFQTVQDMALPVPLVPRDVWLYPPPPPPATPKRK